MDDADDLAARPRLRGNIALAMDGAVFEFGVDVPDGPLNADDMVGVVQSLQSAIVQQAETRTAEAGLTISCKAGCGACCRQAVLVTEAEARALAALVETMPEPQRARIIERFMALGRALDTSPAGRVREQLAKGEPVAEEMAVDYFTMGIPCPFLEDESCSIHAARPIVCREYLVTSDPRHCATLRSRHIRKVPLTSILPGAAKVSRHATPAGLLLLADALTFAAGNPAPSRDRPGPDILRTVIETRAGAPQATRS
jgi:Fe-S-cluster containining protein